MKKQYKTGGKKAEVRKEKGEEGVLNVQGR